MLPLQAHVVVLVARNPQASGKPWLEAMVYKRHGAVHVFSIRSHGRRYFRKLEYAS